MLKFLPHKDTQPAGLTMIITWTLVFLGSPKLLGQLKILILNLFSFFFTAFSHASSAAVCVS